ncbi:MAG: TetR family transcriptional regulator [Kofleriaceae bacterium]|nr:TetR family transcriptional regulator [Kofleriaceae bacterium]
MRYPAEHKAEVRSRILAAAASALRARGLDGISIPALMKKVKLTHGGFYVHFPDRDHLVAEAVAIAAEATGDKVFRDSPDLDTVIDRYISHEHVADPGGGCVVAALGTDAPRQRTPVKRAFAFAVKGMFQLLDHKFPGRTASTGKPSDDALALASLMVGAVMLARLVDDELADRLIRAARKAAHAMVAR